MLNNQQVCERITSLYPDMGNCGDNLEVRWDRENQAWAVDFELDGQKIKHYLENDDAAACIIEGKCVGLGIEFGQFH